MNKNLSMAEELNKGCKCITLDKELLMSQLDHNLVTSRPHLFSATTVYISQDQHDEMIQLISSIEKVVAGKPFREEVLKRTDGPVKETGTSGVFMGYDFHLGADGPKLIEINTNAGGGLLNLELARAQLRCCPSVISPELLALDKEFVSMFRNDWQLQKGDAPLKTIAIIDHHPHEQYLYPEFLLFQKLFKANGIECFIADPSELKWSEGKLFFKDQMIDMVYNRLTDFYLTDPEHRHLSEAYMTGGAAFTPAPFHHALYANKLNLTLLTDKEFLEKTDLDPTEQERILKGIPKTIVVSEGMWEERKKYFFKPFSGYGSKATYRGDKITTKVWGQIIQGGYIAQTLVPPSERIVGDDANHTQMKFDIRAYVYQGKVQLFAARLYTGQTTNFRTFGGGFAPVFRI